MYLLEFKEVYRVKKRVKLLIIEFYLAKFDREPYEIELAETYAFEKWKIEEIRI